MDLLLVPSWRPLAVRGALGVLFGMGAFLWPDVTLASLVLLFGIYALLDGAVAITIGARVRATDAGWLFPLEGLLGVALGLLAVMWVGPTAIGLTIVVGAWALFTGALELAAAIRLRHEVPGTSFLAFGGAASVLLGLLLVGFPHAGSLLLVVLLGSYALVFGTAMLVLAMQLRSHGRSFHSWPHTP